MNNRSPASRRIALNRTGADVPFARGVVLAGGDLRVALGAAFFVMVGPGAMYSRDCLLGECRRFARLDGAGTTAGP